MLPFLMGSSAAAAGGAAGAGAAGAGGSMMSWLPFLGNFLGGMGQFAGGMQGFFDGKGSSLHDQRKHFRKIQEWMWRNQLPEMVKAAKAAGIHPLAALGMSPGRGPAGQVFRGPDKGRALANMGVGLQRAMAGQSELDRAKADYYRAMAERARKPVIAGQPQSEMQVDKKGVLTKGKGYEVVPTQVNPQVAPGYQAGPSGFFNFATVPEGGIQVYPTQKFQESTSEGFHALEYGIRMSSKWAKGISFDNLNTGKGMMARNALRNQQRAVEKQFGGKYAYSPFSRTWYPTNTDRLFIPRGSNILSRFSRKYEYGSGRLQKSHRTPRFHRGSIENESWYFD